MELYSLFLEIPTKCLKVLSTQSENFLNELGNKGEASDINENFGSTSILDTYLLRILTY